MPPKRKANEARYFFFCGKLDPTIFEVLNFSGTDRINTPYEFHIVLISKRDDISPADVINKQATLYMYRDEEFYPYSGIVSSFQFVDKSTDYSTYYVTLNARMWLLNLNVQTRIFQKMSIPDIIKKVMDEANLTGTYTLEVEASRYPELEYVVQYQESDLNFISRLMEENALWYFFKELPVLEDDMDGSPGKEQVIITDDPAKFEFLPTQSEILYRAQSGLAELIDGKQKESVHRFQQERRLIPREVVLKNYNYRTPEIDLSTKKVISKGDVGCYYQYGGSFKDAVGAERSAAIAANRFAVRQTMFEGSSNCQGFRAGSRFNLTEHFRPDFNTTFVITEVRHIGGHASVSGNARVVTYTNHFRCINSSQADNYVPESRAAIARIAGIMTAHIESNGSAYAAIDDLGRYKVRLPFDLSGSKNYDGSKYIRLAQPYSGPNYGIHFPSHEGVEMILGCIDGDPNKPVGLGTVPNANNISPVVSSNRHEGIIRTAGGNELVMNDTDGKQKIRLSTKGKHVIQLDDEKKRLFLRTPNKNALVIDDKNGIAAWNVGAHNITMDYGDKCITITSAGGHVVKIDDAGKKITIQTSAGSAVEMDDNGKKITIVDCNGHNTVQLDGSKGIILESKGNIEIKAAQDLNISASNITMSTSTGNISIAATQGLELSGMKINQKAHTELSLDAFNVAVKGTLSTKVEGGPTGSVVELGPTGSKVKGMTTELNGSIFTTVKGLIVAIN